MLVRSCSRIGEGTRWLYLKTAAERAVAYRPLAERTRTTLSFG